MRPMQSMSRLPISLHSLAAMFPSVSRLAGPRPNALRDAIVIGVYDEAGNVAEATGRPLVISESSNSEQQRAPGRG